MWVLHKVSQLGKWAMWVLLDNASIKYELTNRKKKKKRHLHVGPLNRQPNFDGLPKVLLSKKFGHQNLKLMGSPNLIYYSERSMNYTILKLKLRMTEYYYNLKFKI